MALSQSQSPSAPATQTATPSTGSRTASISVPHRGIRVLQPSRSGDSGYGEANRFRSGDLGYGEADRMRSGAEVTVQVDSSSRMSTVGNTAVTKVYPAVTGPEVEARIQSLPSYLPVKWSLMTDPERGAASQSLASDIEAPTGGRGGDADQ